MTMWIIVCLCLVGLGIGMISGMVGIGGGVLVIPVLMVGFAFSQQKATGTSLAMLLPPIGIFAVMAYARAGEVDWRFAGLLALGFVIGGYIGAWLVTHNYIHPTVLRVGLALFMIYVAGTMLFRSGGRERTAMEALILVTGMAVVYVVLRLLGHKWARKPSLSQTYRRRLRHASIVDYEI
jgi:uncharacterized membrane protein YfcA